MMINFSHVEGLPNLTVLQTEEVNDKRFYITPSGLRVPSVTTVLSYFKQDSLNAWKNKVGVEQATQISNRAKSRGTKFHLMLEKYLENEPVKDILKEAMPDIKQAFFDVSHVLTRLNNIHYIEGCFYSENLGIAGRSDCIAEFDGKLSVIDFKTSKEHKKESWIQDYFIQASAYALMYEEMLCNPIDQIVIIISPSNGDEPQVFVKDKASYVTTLLEKIETFHSENNRESNEKCKTAN